MKNANYKKRIMKIANWSLNIFSNRLVSILLIVTLTSLLFTSSVSAQTEPMYSQYMYNMLGVNPAYAGNREATSVNFFQRRQWVGMAGAPQTTSVSVDGSNNDHKFGWGVQMYDDRLGVEKADGGRKGRWEIGDGRWGN